MDISLTRVDYGQVGTTSRSCIQLLPPGPDGLQKVSVGSNNGSLLLFSRVKQDTQIQFKTLPGVKIECVCLGGALGTLQDKIFVAVGSNIRGFSKKGKQFFSFETNLTENVQSMFIYGVDMLLCGQYTFNHYHDCADAHYYLSSDRINDVICLPVIEGSWVGRGVTPILACDDRSIKILQGSNLAYQVQINAVPNTLILYRNNGGSDGHLVYVGCKDGSIVLIELPVAKGQVLWHIQSTNGSASITAMHCYDITKDGTEDLLIGRDDGIVEIYSIRDMEAAQFLQKFSINESITGLKGGKVASSSFTEIVLTTYTGWVVGLTTEPIQKHINPNEKVVLNSSVELKIQQMRQELEALQERVAAERERYQNSTQQENGVSAMPIFAVHDSFALSKEDAAYTLFVELSVPIDYVLLQCDVPIDLLDVDSNSAVVSQTPCEPNCGNALLATYRCQANTTRLEIKVRSIEGQYGTLQAYVAPRTHPKIAQVRHYSIKPLSLHQRSHVYDSGRPQNKLKLTGNFTLAEAHSWIAFCLPELAEKPPATDTANACFTSTFTNTQLQCNYSKGSVAFNSDNISTIAILRDVLTKEATKKKIKLDISCEVNEDSVVHTLQLLHAKLEYQLNLAKKVHMADALKELTLEEDDTSFLSDELRELVSKADQLAAEQKQQQAHLERTYGVLTDLYIDKFKFKGISVKHKIPQLLQLLDNYTFDSLVAFFQ